MTRKLILIPGILGLIAMAFSCGPSSPQQQLTNEQQAEMISQGKAITQESFKALSGELSKALQEGGVANAIYYCHLRANPITDSLSEKFQVEISRVSDRYRNPADKPDQLDQTVLDAYRQQLADGLELQPHLEMVGDNVAFYAPIVIQNPMCLLCHGDPGTTIETENYNLIRSKYPDDLAIGYKLGDLRGVWKIVFENPASR